MDNKKAILPEQTKTVKSPAEQDKTQRSAQYNYTDMSADTVKSRDEFPKRLAELRLKIGKTGREMSLSLGQGAGYINNIENGNNMPSMNMFFEICEYLGVSPKEYFDYTEENPDRKKELLLAEVRNLGPDNVDLMLTLIRRLRKDDL